MPGTLASTAFAIEFDGQPATPTLAASVIQVVVDDSLHLPDTFAIWLQEDPSGDGSVSADFDIGSTVKISAQGLEDSAPVVLIEGEITAIEGEYSESKPSTVVVRGYDVVHKLMHGRKNKVFTQVSYSDVARQIASDNGYGQTEVEDSGTVYPFVHQWNQTDWEFLKSVARLVGFEVAVRDGTFVFGAPTPASGGPGAGDVGSTDPLQLVFGHDLQEFRPRVTAGGQAKNVIVRGWDVANKQALVADKPVETTSVALDGGDTPARMATAVDDPTVTSADRPLGTQDDVNKVAAALSEQIGSAFAEATGKTRGNPKLRAGAAVSVSQVGRRFNGKYTLTHTRHTYDMRDGYVTRFEVSGRNDRSLLSLAGGGGGGGSAAATNGITQGVQVGIVTDVEDPDTLGRVRVKLPYAGDDFVTGWARIAAPGAGAERGMNFLPEVNDEVLVAFEHGSVRAPIVLGGLWNGQDAPPPPQISAGAAQTRSIVSRAAHRVVFMDESGSEGLRVATGDNNLYLLFDQANKEITLKADGNAKIKLEATGDIELTSTQGSVKISGQMGVEIASQAQAKMSGQAGLNLETSGVAALKGSQVSLG